MSELLDLAGERFSHIESWKAASPHVLGGRDAQETYRQRVWAIEERWQAQFGGSTIGDPRESPESLIGDPAAQR